MPDLGIAEFLRDLVPTIPIYLMGAIAVVLWFILYFGRLKDAAKLVDGHEGEKEIIEKTPVFLRFISKSRVNLFAMYVALDMWFLVPALRKSHLISKSEEFSLARDLALCSGVFLFVLIYTLVAATLVVSWVRGHSRQRQRIRFFFVYLEPFLTGYFIADVVLALAGIHSTALLRLSLSASFLLILTLLIQNARGVWTACGSRGAYVNHEDKDPGVLGAIVQGLRHLQLPNMRATRNYVRGNEGAIALLLAALPVAYTAYTLGFSGVCSTSGYSLIFFGGLTTMGVAGFVFLLASIWAVVGLNKALNWGPAGFAFTLPIYMLPAIFLAESIYPHLPWAINACRPPGIIDSGPALRWLADFHAESFGVAF